jgi:hypothetical protein
MATATFATPAPKLVYGDIIVTLNQIPAPMSAPCSRIFDTATAIKLGQAQCSTDGDTASLTITPVGPMTLALSEWLGASLLLPLTQAEAASCRALSPW